MWECARSCPEDGMQVQVYDTVERMHKSRLVSTSGVRSRSLVVELQYARTDARPAATTATENAAPADRDCTGGAQVPQDRPARRPLAERDPLRTLRSTAPMHRVSGALTGGAGGTPRSGTKAALGSSADRSYSPSSGITGHQGSPATLRTASRHVDLESPF